MICRVWLWLIAMTCALTAAELVPAPVAEYRARLEKPEVLAEEILLTAQETRPVANPNYELPLKAVAFSSMRSTEELEKTLETASSLLQPQAEAATHARTQSQLESSPRERKEEARLWARLATLRLAAGRPKEALAARRRQCEALASVASPDEWLEASLELARAFHRAGDADQASQLLDLARKLTVRGGPLEASTPAAARVQACEAWIRVRDTQASPADRVEALRGAEQALSRALGAAAPETLQTKAELAAMPFSNPDDPRTAETSLRELLAGRETTLGFRHPLTLSAASRLGGFLLSNGEAAEGYRFLRRAYDGWLAGAGLATEERLRTGGRLASYERDHGDFQEVERTYRALVEASTRFSGPESRDTLGYRNGLAIAVSSLGDYAQAEKINRELLEIRTRVFGPADPDTLTSMNNTAVSVSGLGRYREAEELYRAALAARIKVQSEGHREALRTKANLANMRRALGDLPQAEQLSKEVFEQRRKLGTDHVDVLSSLNDLARIALEKGDLVLAEQHARAALEGREQKNGNDHPSTMSAEVLVAEVLAAKGDYAKALEILYHILSQREIRYDKDERGYLATARSLANTLLEAGNFGEAESQIRPVLTAYEKRYGPEHPETVEVSAELGRILLQKGELSAAEPLLRRALAKSESLYDSGHPLVASIACSLADLLHQKGDNAAALPLAERASSIAKQKLPENQRLRTRYDSLLNTLRKPPAAK